MRNEALEFIKRNCSSPPVNITAVAKVLGLNVWESDSLPEEVAGKIFRDLKGTGGFNGYSVVVRAQDPFVRKRFTVAHELAHYLLHQRLFGNELVDNALYRSGLSSSVEAQANGLAADLLMPWHLLLPIADRPVNELAKLFQVSEQAMRIRLESALRRSPADELANTRP
jgi:hypothetical protein